MVSEKRFTLTKGSMILISILLLGFVAIAPHITSYYVTSLMCMIFFYVALVQGLNVLTGFTGYVNFGYAGWVGLGSYATMIFLNKLNMHWLPALLRANFCLP
jgi:branched-chain amino acid transport system permease protein